MEILIQPWFQTRASQISSISSFRDKDKIERIIASLELKLSARDTRNTDPRTNLQAILRQWLPLSNAILGMVATRLPSPLDVPGERIEKLMCGGLRKFDSLPMETQQLKPGLIYSFIFCILAFLVSFKTQPGIVEMLCSIIDFIMTNHSRRSCETRCKIDFLFFAKASFEVNFYKPGPLLPWLK